MNKVTDVRPPFFMVEDAAVNDYGLNAYEGWLYIVMVKHANRKTGELFPSVQTLMRETQMSKASVLRYTKSLEEKELIRVTRDENKNGKDRTVNHYFILAATRYLTDTDPGISQTPTPVSVGNINQSNIEPESINKINKATSPFDSMKNSIQKAFGWDKPTGNEWGQIGKAASQLLKVDIAPEDIALLHSYCKAQSHDKSFTPLFLTVKASDWKKNRPQQIIPDQPTGTRHSEVDDGTPATPEQIAQAKAAFAALVASKNGNDKSVKVNHHE